jgi:hypothetical protein
MASGATYTKKRAREEFGLTAFPPMEEAPSGNGGGGGGGGGGDGGDDTDKDEEEGAGAAKAPAKRMKLTQAYVHALALRTYGVGSLDEARAAGAKKLARLGAAAAARAATAAPCARCGAANTRKLQDGSGACAACAPCGDCGARVGTELFEDGFGASAAALRRVCATCHAQPRYERMWFSDALKQFKLQAEDLDGVRKFELPSRRHGIRKNASVP